MSDEAEAEAEAMQLQWQLRSAGLLPAPAEVEAYLGEFDVSADRGFAPTPDPLPRLATPGFEPYEALADTLPQLLATGQLRPAVEALNHAHGSTTTTTTTDLEGLVGRLQDDRERRRALLLLAGLANAYAWGGGPDVVPRDRIPACLAVPLHRLASLLGTAPILSHQSNCLFNWERRQGRTTNTDTDTDSLIPIRALELDTTFSFTGEQDEAMFYLLTLEIEALGGPALAELEAARRLVSRLSPTTHEQLLPAAHAWLALALRRVKARVDRMRGVMESMPRHVRPLFFYHCIRPYLAGWKGNPTLPNGVVYEGVEGGARLQLSGGSAAQSSIIAALDLYLGIDLGAPSASSRNSYGFVRSMRAYMPRPHARFLEALEADMKGPPNLRGYVAALQQREGKEGEAAVVAAYNACVGALVAFRRAHLSIVQTFILRQQEAGEGDSGGAGLEKAAGGKGTGGMPLVEFLAPIKAETEAAKLLGGNGKD